MSKSAEDKLKEIKEFLETDVCESCVEYNKEQEELIPCEECNIGVIKQILEE